MTTNEMPKAARTATALEWGFIVRSLGRKDALRAKRVAEGQEVFVEGSFKIMPPKGTPWTVDGALAGCAGLSPLQELEARVAEEDRAAAAARLSATPSEIEHIETRSRFRHAGLERVRAADAETKAKMPRVVASSGLALAELVDAESGEPEGAERSAPGHEPIAGHDASSSGTQLALLIEADRIGGEVANAG